ncbi:MAG: nuclear transport factor 2 family protein [Pyrinomonadaceae bacterium]
MKTLILTLALAAAFTSPAPGQTPTPEPEKRTSEDQELKALDLAWHQAVATRDVDALGRLLADDYRFDLDAKRLLTKAQEIGAVKTSAPPFDFDSFKLGGVTVRIERERATLSGILTAKPVGGGKDSRRRYFYTRNFLRRDGRWQILTAGLVTL